MKLTVTETKEIDTKGWTFCAYLGDVFDEMRCFSGNDHGVDFAFADQGFSSVEEFEKRYPELIGIQPPYYYGEKEGKKTILLKIDLNTGKVLNWPKSGIAHSFVDYKIVDTGRYEIRDKKGNIVAQYTGYVPSCVGHGGWGDYLTFSVDVQGNVSNWSFDQTDYDEIVGSQD